MEANYELSHLEYGTSSIEISDDIFNKGYDEIQQLLNSYSKIGIHPRLGEKYIPMTDGFDTPVIVTAICYCSHKIMVECECL
jgi:hypothetical protein